MRGASGLYSRTSVNPLFLKVKTPCLMQNMTPENKLRLLMIYASVCPEKFEGDKASKLMQVGKAGSNHPQVFDRKISY